MSGAAVDGRHDVEYQRPLHDNNNKIVKKQIFYSKTLFCNDFRLQKLTKIFLKRSYFFSLN